MSELKPVFLYLRGAKPSKSVLARLEESGYLPVPVMSFDDVRIVTPAPSYVAEGDVITKAALETIEGQSSPTTRENFARNLCKRLLTIPADGKEGE